MEHILAMAGLAAVALLTAYIFKIIDNYYYDKETGTKLNQKVYRSARAFAQGEPVEAVRSILIDSLDFDVEEIEEVISASLPHRNDSDGGVSGLSGFRGKSADELLTK